MKLKSLTPTIIKIVAFAAVIGVLTYVIIAILEPSSDGPSSERSAVFSDASGLKPRDGVRLAGVKVGYVTAIDLKGATAVVHFQLNDDVTITSNTTAAVRYQNLLGQRYVELIGAEQGKTQGHSHRWRSTRLFPHLMCPPCSTDSSRCSTRLMPTRSMNCSPIYCALLKVMEGYIACSEAGRQHHRLREPAV